MFRDRTEAGEKLTEILRSSRLGINTLVLGLARGGVMVAAEISRRLDLPMDVFICNKLKAPWNEQLALGAVTETGHVFLNREYTNSGDLPADFLDNQVRQEILEIDRRRRIFRGGRPLPSLSGKTVLLVDDGIITGATFLAAAESLRQLGPLRLTAAIPVGPLPVIATLGKLVDELAILEAPEEMRAIARYYHHFTAVSDETVIEQLSLRQDRVAAHGR